jgi:hypothetical protein
MALLEERKRKLAAEGCSTSLSASGRCPTCPGDRRRHLADRRRDPRHPAPARRPLPAPRAGLAGAGAGRDSARRRSRRHPGLQRAAPDGRRGRTCSSWRAAAARSRICGASTRRSWCAPWPASDPGDLGGRPRDRLDADRPCRRPARADADGGGRDGRAGRRGSASTGPTPRRRWRSFPRRLRNWRGRWRTAPTATGWRTNWATCCSPASTSPASSPRGCLQISFLPGLSRRGDVARADRERARSGPRIAAGASADA